MQAVISCSTLSAILLNMKTEERPRLTSNKENRLLTGIKAPHIQSSCMIRAEASHLSVMVIRINSLAIRLSPNMAGKEIKAVNRSILWNTAA